VGNEFGIPLDRRRAEASGHGHRGDIVREQAVDVGLPVVPQDVLLLPEVERRRLRVDQDQTMQSLGPHPSELEGHEPAAATKAGAAMIVVGSTGPRSSLLGSISADVSRRAPCPVVVVPPGGGARVNGHPDVRVAGHPGGRESAGEDRDFAGGIARLGLGDGGTEFAGGIARFGLGQREAGG
jgi:nucleotide-binding universal stress UspA family protein